MDFEDQGALPELLGSVVGTYFALYILAHVAGPRFSGPFNRWTLYPFRWLWRRHQKFVIGFAVGFLIAFAMFHQP